MTCPECSQVWHNSCAGLQASFTQPVLDSLLLNWSCPWCFVCPFPAPKGHKSGKNEKDLKEKVLTAATIQQITESVAEVIGNTLKAPDFVSLGHLLENFSKEVQEYKENFPPSANATPHFKPPPAPSTSRLSLATKERPYQSYTEEFLSEEELTGLTDFLKGCKETSQFQSENGHSVMTLGLPYHYTGSKSENKPPPIPSELQMIIDKMMATLNLTQKPNSILVNHYESAGSPNTDSSFLPFHCDDEKVILPDSQIATLTVGGTREITFQHLHNPTEEEVKLSPASNSLYVMTRASQAWYKHGIHATDEAVEERFSLTFRTVSEKFQKSLIIIGDSNTKDILFGPGAGKIGESYPGKRVKAGNKNQIDPTECIGYANIAIVCGTNNLREDNIVHPSEVGTLVEKLANKLSQIKRLCPKSHITVMPVLPTRLPRMNKNIMMFNDLVSRMLETRFHDISQPGIYDMLDKNQLLSMNLTRERDNIHLNQRGISGLVKAIKQSVYGRFVNDRRAIRKFQESHSTNLGGSTEPP